MSGFYQARPSSGGAPGQQGLTSVGIQAANINTSGHLVLTKTDNTTIDAGSVQAPRGLSFNFISPGDNAQSPRYIAESNFKIAQLRFVATTAPTASTTVTLYQNGTTVATFSTTTASLTFDIDPDIAVTAGDVLYIAFGTINGLINITVQATVIV